MGKNRWQWGRVGDCSGQKEMMLNTDICLAYGSFADKAAEQSCCAWILPSAFTEPSDAKNAVQILAGQEEGPEKWCGFNSPANTINDQPPDLVKHWCCRMGSVQG